MSNNALLAEQLRLLDAKFTGKRRGEAPDDWPEQDDHVSFLVISLEVLRGLSFLVALITAFLDDAGDNLMVILGGILALEIGYRLVRPDDRPWRKRLFRKGKFHHGVIVQCNNQAFDSDLENPVPGTVLYSSDPLLGSDLEALQELAGKVAGLKYQDRRTMADDVGALAWQLYHEMCPNPRMAVPASLGAPAGTWIADVSIHPGDHTTAEGSLPVLALAQSDHWAATQVVPGELLDKIGL